MSKAQKILAVLFALILTIAVLQDTNFLMVRILSHNLGNYIWYLAIAQIIHPLVYLGQILLSQDKYSGKVK